MPVPVNLSASDITATSVRLNWARWTPLQLFLAGVQGVWFDPSDVSTLFQDAAGTIPVTADGDPDGLIVDSSGNGNGASQSVSSARPTYKTDGSLHYIYFDGVDDILRVLDNAPKTHLLASVANQVSCFFAVRQKIVKPRNNSPNWVSSATIFDFRTLGDTNVKVPLSFGLNGGQITVGGTADYIDSEKVFKISAGPILSVNTANVIGFVLDGSNLDIYLDGAIVGSFSDLPPYDRSTENGGSNISVSLGARVTDGNQPDDHFGGDIFQGVLIDRVMSSSEIDKTVKSFAAKSGVTL